jgi:hypothetical protein
MTAPNFQAAGTPAGSSVDLTIAWPVHQADDIGLFVVETLSTDPAPTAPTNWGEVADSPQAVPDLAGTAETRLSTFWKRAAGAAEADATITDVGNHQIGNILTFRGCIATGDPWDVTAGNHIETASTSVSVPGDTTTVADCLIVAACAAGTDTADDQFSSFANADLTDVTEREDFFAAVANGGGFGVATGVKASAGLFGATTATLATSALQARIMVALKPPATENTIDWVIGIPLGF